VGEVTDVRELVGLPAGGPTSVPEVREQLDMDDADIREDTQLASIVAAVNSELRTWSVAADAVDAAEWPARITQGATMLAARLFRRKGSPAGVESFGSLGAAYVMRTDPDIAMLLKLGSWQRPQVG
jgi:hypothetical protein